MLTKVAQTQLFFYYGKVFRILPRNASLNLYVALVKHWLYNQEIDKSSLLTVAQGWRLWSQQGLMRRGEL